MCQKKKISDKCRGSCGQTLNPFCFFCSSSLLEEGKSLFFSLSSSCARLHGSSAFSSSSANFLLMGFLPEQEASNRLLYAKTRAFSDEGSAILVGIVLGKRQRWVIYAMNRNAAHAVCTCKWVADRKTPKKKKGKGNNLDADSSSSGGGGGHRRCG